MRTGVTEFRGRMGGVVGTGFESGRWWEYGC
jgi:hypothetical protein